MVKIGKWVNGGWAIVRQDLARHALLFLMVSILSCTVVLYGVAMCGYMGVLLRKLRHPDEPLMVLDLFKAFKVFVPSLLVGVVLMLLYPVGGIAFGVGTYVVQALLFFAFPLVIDKGFDGWGALRTSFRRTKPHWLELTLFFILTSLISGAGSLACLVGLFFTAPIGFAAAAVAYHDIWGDPQEESRQ